MCRSKIDRTAFDFVVSISNRFRPIATSGFGRKLQLPARFAALFGLLKRSLSCGGNRSDASTGVVVVRVLHVIKPL